VTGWEALAVLASGVAAGTINTIVGSGTLVTFPTLLAVGYPPVLANVSNTVGLVAGSVSGAVGYRRELAGQRGRLLRLGAATTAGALTGGLLLLTLPPGAFRAIVPVLIALGGILVVLQPKLTAVMAARSAHRGPRPAHGSLWLVAGVLAIGVYGGYFGAAQGVLLIAVLGLFLDEPLQRVNGAKNVLAGLANLVAAVLFVAVTHVAWAAAALIAVGSVAGAVLGATFGRRLSPRALRAAVVVVCVAALVKLLG
jgi:uncharacterized protein